MFVIIFVSLIAGTCGFLTAVPENAAVIEGTTVVMKCQTNDASQKIFWKAPLSQSLPKKIFSGERISQDWSEICSLDNSSQGQYDLIINSTMSAGTQYVCEEGPFGHLNGSIGSAELIVLAGDPNCSFNLKTEDMKVTVNQTYLSFEMQCIVRYSGNWAPLMECRQEGCQEPMSAEFNSTVQNNTVISTLAVSANITNNLTRYICTMRFDKSNKPNSTTAENVPVYFYNWTSPLVVITNEIPSTTYSYSGTTTSSSLKEVIILVAVIQGVILAIFILLLLKRIFFKKKSQRNIHDLHFVRETDISQHRHETPEPVVLDNCSMPPLYATVNDPDLSRSVQADLLNPSIHDSQTTSVYSMARAQVDHARETSQRSTDHVQGFLIRAADGTEYKELSQIKSPNCSKQQAPRKNLFDTSIYAQIDHTISAPPPPPQPPKFLR